MITVYKDPSPQLINQDRRSLRRNRDSSNSEQETEGRLQVRRMLGMLDVIENRARILQDEDEEDSGLRQAVPQQP